MHRKPLFGTALLNKSNKSRIFEEEHFLHEKKTLWYKMIQFTTNLRQTWYKSLFGYSFKYKYPHLFEYKFQTQYPLLKQEEIQTRRCIWIRLMPEPRLSCSYCSAEQHGFTGEGRLFTEHSAVGTFSYFLHGLKNMKSLFPPVLTWCTEYSFKVA